MWRGFWEIVDAAGRSALETSSKQPPSPKAPPEEHPKYRHRLKGVVDGVRRPLLLLHPGCEFVT